MLEGQVDWRQYAKMSKLDNVLCATIGLNETTPNGHVHVQAENFFKQKFHQFWGGNDNDNPQALCCGQCRHYLQLQSLGIGTPFWPSPPPPAIHLTPNPRISRISRVGKRSHFSPTPLKCHSAAKRGIRVGWHYPQGNTPGGRGVGYRKRKEKDHPIWGGNQIISWMDSTFPIGSTWECRSQFVPSPGP